MALGDAYINVHADTDPFERELKRNLDKDLAQAGADANKIMDEVGKGWGEHVSKSTAEEIRRHGPDFAHAIESSTVGKHVKIRYTYDYDREGVLKGFKKVVTEVEGAVGQAFSKGMKNGVNDVASFGQKFFSKIRSTLTDAIGSAFNVSGKSPLIPFLALIGLDIAGLILAAVQAANALVAALSAVPALLTSIGLQAGVLLLAFQGMKTAIQSAFAAKNTKEMETALRGLTPAAKDFVRELVSIKSIFSDIKYAAQQEFFKGLGSGLTNTIKEIGPALKNLTASLSGALGEFFKVLLSFFSSPAFVTFIDHVVFATVKFLDKFGPKLITFLEGFISFADASISMLNSLGDGIGDSLESIGNFLDRVAKDPETKKWFENMKKTLATIKDLFKSITEFIAAFADQLDKAGGNKIIKQFGDTLDNLTKLIESPTGKKAMQELVALTVVGIWATEGLVKWLIKALSAAKDFFDYWTPQMMEFWDMVTEIPGAISDVFVGTARIIKKGLDLTVQLIVTLFSWIIKKAKGWFSDISGKFDNLKNTVSNALGNIVNTFYTKGKEMISSLINGFKAKFGALRHNLSNIAGMIGSVFGASPAKWGPLSGQGWMEPRGKKLMSALNEGMQQGAQAVRNTSSQVATSVALGNVNLNFYGQQPTERDARMAGTAASSEIATRLAVSQTRLAVRMA